MKNFRVAKRYAPVELNRVSRNTILDKLKNMEALAKSILKLQLKEDELDKLSLYGKHQSTGDIT